MDGRDWQRLGAYVANRRTELGYDSQEKLGDVAGVSGKTVGRLERGGSVNGTTLAKIELALKWKPGSAREVLSGREPTLLAASEADPEDRVWETLRAKYEAWHAEFGPDQAWAMLRREATDVVHLIDERRRRHAERDRRDAG